MDANTTEHSVFGKILASIAETGGFDNINDLMVKLAREQAYGNRKSIFADVLGGFNRRTQGVNAPANSDQHGLTFFTRPNLNLSYDNIAMVRSLTPLMSRSEDTMQRAIRCMLDRETAKEYPSPGLFDNKHAFFPILTNLLISCSGWPDMSTHVYNSSEGVMKEVWIMNDSIAEINGFHEITATFQNIMGDPITLLFFVWLHYMGAVYVGKMAPYPQSIVENEIDYMTRIYRFTMDPTLTYIQGVVTTGASIPYAVPIGSKFNFSRDQPYTEEANQITIPFASTGIIYNDPISLQEFNIAGELFNPALAEARKDSKGPLVYLNPTERHLFNYVGFPKINLRTNELEWYVDREVYAEYKKGNL